MSEVNQVISESVIEGNVLRLPPQQLDRSTYLGVKKALGLIGGSWKGGKVAGFVFPNDPTPLVQELLRGNKPNLQKDFQFFATPRVVAERMIQQLFIYSPPQGRMLLEPSAGQGALIDVVRDTAPHLHISAYELMDVNYAVLRRKYGGSINLLGRDFLTETRPTESYNYILANPPFAKNQDIDHIRHMYGLLVTDGRMVTLSSRHWELSSNKKETQFREWLEEVEAEVEPMEPGLFKESGTMVAVNMITIQK